MPAENTSHFEMPVRAIEPNIGHIQIGSTLGPVRYLNNPWPWGHQRGPRPPNKGPTLSLQFPASKFPL